MIAYQLDYWVSMTIGACLLVLVPEGRLATGDGCDVAPPALEHLCRRVCVRLRGHAGARVCAHVRVRARVHIMTHLGDARAQGV
jgi:hypothetical protein